MPTTTERWIRAFFRGMPLVIVGMIFSHGLQEQLTVRGIAFYLLALVIVLFGRLTFAISLDKRCQERNKAKFRR